MKLRHPWLMKAATSLGTLFLRGWMSTLSYKFHSVGPDVDPHSPHLSEFYFYPFWHETLLLPPFRYAKPGSKVLISQSHDGDLIADVCTKLGFKPVRGSSSRHGFEAMRALLQTARQTHVGIAIDGPRGPRRVAQIGVVYLAARSGMGIVPTGFAMHRPWRMKSWDRFCFPRPFTRTICVGLPPIYVPPIEDTEKLEPYRVQLQEAMDRATYLAEELVETGTVDKTNTVPASGSRRDAA